jgi:hypothetical protein
MIKGVNKNIIAEGSAPVAKDLNTNENGILKVFTTSTMTNSPKPHD